MIVSSYYPGRIRLREEVFKDPVIVEECKRILSSSDAVTNIENNYRTGSVLLEYNPDKVPMEKLKPLVPFFQEVEKLTHNYSAGKQKAILDKLDEFKSIVEKW